MPNDTELNELRTLWEQLLGDPPAHTQFVLWAAEHKLATVRWGIMRTCRKNLSVAETMSADHKIRFASKCMLSKTYDPQRASIA